MNSWLFVCNNEQEHNQMKSCVLTGDFVNLPLSIGDKVYIDSGQIGVIEYIQQGLNERTISIIEEISEEKNVLIKDILAFLKRKNKDVYQIDEHQNCCFLLKQDEIDEIEIKLNKQNTEY